jgi:hypothetical protein
MFLGPIHATPPKNIQLEEGKSICRRCCCQLVISEWMDESGFSEKETKPVKNNFRKFNF